MATSYTENYSFKKPEPGSGRNTWGYDLNDSMDSIDEEMKKREDGVNASVKKAGDVMTGSLSFDTNTKGIVLSGDTRIFDVTNGNTQAKALFIDLAGSTLKMRSEDGDTLLLQITEDEMKFRGKHVLVSGDGSYISNKGGSIDGDLDVDGKVSAKTFEVDSLFYLKMIGDQSTINVGSSSNVNFDRSAKTWSWVTAGNPRMTLDGSGNLKCDGDVVAGSDERLKTDIVPITGALDALDQIRGVSFTRIADRSQGIGVIAQEVEAVFPQAVHTDADGMKAVAYANLVGPLIAAVQELRAEVAALRAGK